MLGFFRRFRSTPDASRDLEAAVKAVGKVIDSYGDFLERNPMPLGLMLVDETELPYPKKTILTAICLALGVQSDPDTRASLISCAMVLANFQPGVGKTPLHPLGNEVTLSDINTLSTETLIAKVTSDPAAKARYDDLMPTVKNEISQLGARLTQVDEAFYAGQSGQD
ncbi:MAG TPA: hypothetical protein VIJ52_03545 [Pseudolabrys sp.]